MPLKEWELNYMTMQMKIQSEREDAAIEATIKTLLKFNIADDAIVENLVSDFDLTKDEARKRIQIKKGIG